MDDELFRGNDTTKTNRAPGDGLPYEAPRVETVLTAEDLSREVQYAGLSNPG